jgi:hypothetical protein
MRAKEQRNMRHYIFNSSASLIALAAILTGCQFETRTEAQLGTLVSGKSHLGKVKVLAGSIEHPDSDIASASIRVLKVQIRDASGNFLTFLEEPFDLNLTDLASGIEPILGRARVPEGEYDHIRLETAEAGSITLSDGSSHVLVVPSGEQTGIKIFFDQTVKVVNGTIQRVSLKFDLSRSFVARGQDIFHFKPVVRAEITEVIDQNPDDGSENSGDGENSGDHSGDSSGDSSGESSGDNSGDNSGDHSGEPTDGGPVSDDSSGLENGGDDYPIIGT